MTNHRWASVIAIGAWLIFLLICGITINRTQFTTDLTAFLPKNPTPEQQLLLDQIHDGLASRLILVGLEGEDASKRATLSKLMAHQLRKDHSFVTINNGEPVYSENDQAFLFNHRYLLSPAINPEHFSVNGLNQSINESIELLASPAGLIIKSILPRDPTGEMLQLLNQFNSDRQPELIDGAWASRDGQRALLLIETRASGADTDAQQNAMTQIQNAFNLASKALTKTNSDKSLNAQLVMTGPGVFSVNTRNTIKNQVFRLSMISMTLIAILLLLVYRSFSALILGLLPVLSGALAGVAAVSLGFGAVHGITLGFGTALIGEAVDYSIYLFIQSEHGNTHHDSWIKRFWPTIRLGVLTSICGFASLLFSGFPGLAQLGLYAISGLITAAMVTRFVLPKLLPSTFHIHDVTAIGLGLTKLVNKACKLRWSAIVLLVIACLILFNHRTDLWSKEISSLSPLTQADIALDTKLRADVGAPDVRYLVVVTGASRESVLQSSEQVSSLLQKQVDEGTIASFESPSRYLPSEATQRARLASLPTSAELKENLIQATENLPVKPQLFAPFLADIASARKQPLIEADQLQQTSMAMALDALLLQQADHWSALLPLTAPKNMEINASKIQAALNASQLANVIFIDMKTESDHLYAGYMQEAIMLSLSGLIAIIILLLATLRSITQVLRIIAPLAAAVITVTAGLAYLGQQLIILHLVGLLLVVAVGSNYALFFNQSSTNASNSPRTFASMLFASLTTVIGFGLLAFSNVSILQAMGVTVAPGVILALIYSTVLQKAQMPNTRPYQPTLFIKMTIGLHLVALILTIIVPKLWPWTLGAVIINHLAITGIGLWPRSQWLGTNWTHLPDSAIARNEVALTIDDGPDPIVTPDVLKLLNAHHVKATFFCIGEKVALYPELCREIINQGHAIENHSQHHRHYFSLLGVQSLKQEIELAQNTITNITQQQPLFFRAPAGLRNPFLEPALAQLDLTLASWTVRGFDTKVTDANQIKKTLLNKLRAGAILLMHDGNAAHTKQGVPIILEILPDILASAKLLNLHFVTLRQCQQ